MAYTPFPPAYTSSAVDSATIEAAVEDYLTANPPGLPNHADLPDLDASGHPASEIEYTDVEGIFGAENGVLPVQTVLGLLATVGEANAQAISGLAAVAGSGAYSDLSGRPDLSEFVSSDDISTIDSVTQAEYDALDPTDPDTFYVIVG